MELSIVVRVNVDDPGHDHEIVSLHDTGGMFLQPTSDCDLHNPTIPYSQISAIGRASRTVDDVTAGDSDVKH